jgi:hypothetical protein
MDNNHTVFVLSAILSVTLPGRARYPRQCCRTRRRRDGHVELHQDGFRTRDRPRRSKTRHLCSKHSTRFSTNVTTTRHPAFGPTNTPSTALTSNRVATGCSGLSNSLHYEHGLILADADYVVVHGRFSGHGQPAAWWPPTWCGSRTASWPSIGTYSKTRRPKRNRRADCPCSAIAFPDDETMGSLSGPSKTVRAGPTLSRSCRNTASVGDDRHPRNTRIASISTG